MLVHDTDKSEKIIHEGREYESLGGPGTLGHGVFDLPHSVARFLLGFPNWRPGHPDHGDPIVIKASGSSAPRGDSTPPPEEPLSVPVVHEETNAAGGPAPGDIVGGLPPDHDPEDSEADSELPDGEDDEHEADDPNEHEDD